MAKSTTYAGSGEEKKKLISSGVPKVLAAQAVSRTAAARGKAGSERRAAADQKARRASARGISSGKMLTLRANVKKAQNKLKAAKGAAAKKAASKALKAAQSALKAASK